MHLAPAISLYLKTLRNPITHQHYAHMLARFASAVGDRPLSSITRADLAIYLTSLSPGSAHDMSKRLRAFLSWCLDMGLIDQAPTIKSRYKPRGHTTWTTPDIETFRAYHAPGTLPRLVLELALATGLRRADLCRVLWQGESANLKTSKTGTTVYLDLAPTLARYAVSPGSRGCTPHNLSVRFRRWCLAAGLKGRCLHGLRRAFLTRAAEAGCTSHELMTLAGHRTLAMVQHYTASVERSKLAQSALAKLAGA